MTDRPNLRFDSEEEMKAQQVSISDLRGRLKDALQGENRPVLVPISVAVANDGEFSSFVTTTVGNATEMDKSNIAGHVAGLLAKLRELVETAYADEGEMWDALIADAKVIYRRNNLYPSIVKWADEPSDPHEP